MSKLFAAASLAALLIVPSVCAVPAWAAEPDISAARLSEHVRVISSDAYEGRGPATPAEVKTVDYLVGQMKAEGLQPGGDPDPKAPGGRRWTQDVPLARFEVTGPIALSLTAGGQTRTLTQTQEIVVQTLVPTAHVAIKDAPLVFVGYGVKAPERNWDDFKGVDLHGKIAVVLINDPDFEADLGGRFDGRSMTYYGRWTYKYEEAARQGAVGMLIVHEDKPAAYGWNTVKNSNANAQFDIVRDDPSKAHPLLQGWIQRDLAVDLFAKSGLDFEALKKAAQREDFHPVELKGARFSADYAVNSSQIVSHNVLGILPGTKRPDETVIYTAHWDHLGVGTPDAKGDRIYNGAVDNGTGVAAVLELGRAYAAAPRTDRSVLFLLVTAEEKGLLGSAYYATHPLYPAAKTVADLNMDALSTDGAARDFSVSGDGKVSLLDDLIAVGKAHGRAFVPDPTPEAGHFYRSDHFSFAKVGVPAISFHSGEDLVNGGVTAGRAWATEYTAHRYHQPADEWSADWDLSGQVQDITLLYDLGRDLATSDRWPDWKPGSEFKALRDATSAERK
ncbi:M28 family metallopeptidase [Caulobacter sp. KR2-114]|uniref:M28 family metallopeptidase n=1 Tax=Caulobacter sp. KR2-114 TaxID=3400912 RepID=UPI003BFF95D9